VNVGPQMHTATLHTTPLQNAKAAYMSANGFINELTSLYNQYVIDVRINRLLKAKIERCNSEIEKYIDNRENSYLLFCETNFDRAITHINDLKQKAEFLLNTLAFVSGTTKNRELKKLLAISIEVLQKFLIKLQDFLDVNIDLKTFPGTVDENSEDYDNKLAQIAECILHKNKVKTGNSIRETLGLQS
jgi:hypothetical protein